MILPSILNLAALTYRSDSIRLLPQNDLSLYYIWFRKSEIDNPYILDAYTQHTGSGGGEEGGGDEYCIKFIVCRFEGELVWAFDFLVEKYDLQPCYLWYSKFASLVFNKRTSSEKKILLTFESIFNQKKPKPLPETMNSEIRFCDVMPEEEFCPVLFLPVFGRRPKNVNEILTQLDKEIDESTKELRQLGWEVLADGTVKKI